MISVRAGIVGISSRFWSESFAESLSNIPGSDFVAVTGFNHKPEDNILPEEFAQKHKVELYHNPVKMVEQEGLKAVCIRTKHTEMASYVESIANTGVCVNMYITTPGQRFFRKDSFRLLPT